jgi:hypothetical protein
VQNAVSVFSRSVHSTAGSIQNLFTFETLSFCLSLMSKPSVLATDPLYQANAKRLHKFRVAKSSLACKFFVLPMFPPFQAATAEIKQHSARAGGERCQISPAKKVPPPSSARLGRRLASCLKLC